MSGRASGGANEVPLDGTSGAVQGGVAAALGEISGIVQESTSSASAEALAKLISSEDKVQWWKRRLDLDERINQLLMHMDAGWLGPWR